MRKLIESRPPPHWSITINTYLHIKPLHEFRAAEAARFRGG